MVLLYPQQTLLQSDGTERTVLLFYRYSPISDGKEKIFYRLPSGELTTNRCHEIY